MTPEAAPEPLVELFSRHRPVHPYGLADLEEPYWSRSRWWRRGDAVVGLVVLPEGADPVVYAVSAADHEGTLELLAELAIADLPERFVITGPCGLAERLSPTYEAVWSSPHRKLHLVEPERLQDAGKRVERLDREATADIAALLASDPDAGDFFHPHLLDSGHYRGIREDGALVAMAGVHVVSLRHGVAAIGNVATHPGYRRRGLARSVMSALARTLLEEVDVVGLNVAAHNVGALRLYESLGFEVLVTYDEAELRRPG